MQKVNRRVFQSLDLNDWARPPLRACADRPRPDPKMAEVKKEKEMADVKKDSRMLFVRGIGFDVDEKVVEAAFSDVGPVKQCFLIKTKGEARHKGFGFVEYALKEDAERAVLEMQGKDVGGRKVLVSAGPDQVER